MLRGLLLKLAGKRLGAWLRSVADGRLYAALHGRKTLLGAGLAGITYALVATGQQGALEWLTGTGAVLLVGAGLLDKAWKATPPPESAFVHRLSVLIREHALDVGAVLSAAFGALSTCDPSTAALLAHVHAGSWVLTCGQATAALTFCCAFLAWLTGEAALAPPPLRRAK